MGKELWGRHGTARRAIRNAGASIKKLKLILKVLSWSVLDWKGDMTDLDLTQIPMLTSWDTAKVGWNGVHELFTPRKWIAQQGPEDSDGRTSGSCWKLLENELTACYQLFSL